MSVDIHTAPTQVMTPEAAQDSFELPPEYAFMASEHIDRLRAEQLEAETVVWQSALSSGDAYNAKNTGLQELRNDVDTEAEAYVAAHINREEDPTLFDACTQLVADASYHRTSGEAWYLGEPDENGNHTRLETSGLSKYETKLKELFGGDRPNDPEPEPNPIPPLPRAEDIQTAETTLSDTRKQLAELSVQRRRLARKGGKKAKALEEQFVAAQEAYEEARMAMGRLHTQSWQHAGIEPDAIRANVVSLLLDEHQNFTKAEMEFLAEDPSRKAKLARFLAGHKHLFAAANGVVGFGIGFGLSKASKGALTGALGLVGAATLPAALAAGVAVKTTKAVLQSSLGNHVRQHHTHDVRATQDYEELEHVSDYYIDSESSADEMLASANELLSDRIHKRVNKDIKSNRNRVIASVAIGGIAGTAGFLVGSELGDTWPFGGTKENNSSPSLQPEASEEPTVKPEPTPAATPELPEEPSDTAETTETSDMVDGFRTRVTIGSGDGFTHALTDLAQQKDINLSGTESWQLYEHLEGKFDGNFFTDTQAYRMADGNWGISSPGTAQWDPAVIHEMNRWLEENDLETKNN